MTDEEDEARAYRSMLVSGLIVFVSSVAFMVWITYSVIESIKGGA